MIEKKINKKWVKFDGLKHVKKGDMFRIVNDECRKGPIMQATFDAVQVLHPSKPNKKVWSVKAPIMVPDNLEEENFKSFNLYGEHCNVTYKQ